MYDISKYVCNKSHTLYVFKTWMSFIYFKVSSFNLVPRSSNGKEGGFTLSLLMNESVNSIIRSFLIRCNIGFYWHWTKKTISLRIEYKHNLKQLFGQLDGWVLHKECFICQYFVLFPLFLICLIVWIIGIIAFPH